MAGEDPTYCRRLLMLSCSGCGGRSEVVHHMTGAGGSLRAHDHDGMPLCDRCHRSLHQMTWGPFACWTGEQIRAWERVTVAHLHELLEPGPRGPRKRPRRKHRWPKRALPAGRKIPSRPLRRTQRKDG